jgi:GNAT superfamily N-acetyltransferase
VSTFIIRPATTGDAPRLGQLRDEMFAELGRRPDPGAPAFRDRAAIAFAEGFRHGTCEAWVAESPDGGLVGSVAMLVYPRLPSPESPAVHEGYLLNVYTIPAWRGRGIAAALVSASIDRARKLGMGRIRLHATEAGQRVYEKAGFKTRVDEMELRL